MKSKHLIICGCFRSGTSIVSAMLGQHSEILMVNELWVYRNMGSVNRKIDRLREVYPKVGGSKSTIPLHILGDRYPEFLEDHKENKILDTNDILDRLERFSQKKNLLYRGDKLPEYAYDIERLSNEYPGAKFIFCIRDPRGVIESQVKRYKYFLKEKGTKGNNYWANETVEECILAKRNWLTFMQEWDKNKHLVDGYELYFDNLAIDPINEARSLALFLEVNIQQLQQIFTKKFNPCGHRKWEDSLKGITSKLPDSWKEMMNKYEVKI